MKKFRIEGTEIWFGYTEETREKAIAKAILLTESHPDAKIIYDDDRSNTTDSSSGDSDSTTVEESAVPTNTKKTRTREKTTELPDLLSPLGNGSNVDPILGI